MKNKIFLSLSSLFILALFAGCKKGGAKEFLFPVSKDIELGQELSDYIDQNPAEYPLVDSTKNPELYQSMYAFRDVILNSGEITYKNEFAWKIKIIDDANTLNAFAAPGGFIYIYTGIINYLDSANHFAGVMGHEMAHADRRHSINQMIQNSGVQILLEITLGDKSGLAQVASGLSQLKFSRGDEREADAYSVQYLCNTQYKANGAAGFFAKLIAEEATGSVPEFLSTHPSPENRVEDINKQAVKLGCVEKEGGKADWKKIKEYANNIIK